MYIALKKYKDGSHHILRESYTKNNQLTFRNLFDLGSDPSLYIQYAGGNAFYFNEKMEDAISKKHPNYDSDELEDLLWPWIKPDIRRAIETFKNRSSQNQYKTLTNREKNHITANVHSFDKRRAHYLKFGSMDQGAVEKMPASLFKGLVNKSRDEIENRFIQQEYALKSHELKSYVYTVFNLHSFFSGFMARKMPHVLEQKKVDTFFLKEICRLNKTLFNKDHYLDEYMIRYSIMFFDNQYAHTTLLDDFARDFISRHRFFTPAPQKSISTDKACEIFNINKMDLKSMTKEKLSKLYRRLARDVHPDTGGSHDKFVALSNAYQNLASVI
jgi:hypothetical protein